ncbi:cation transporter [Romboutsia maritimum]|uniref:Cation transporter n=1 Tax=Romboutsia maritimum TaxID=2020948 RepID=A0A371IR49_9FIRM|nr:CorA family divalent cation transporter [Romboutsia maritimum]RDY22944.1 cation transporter [Romboutsia maritimum]
MYTLNLNINESKEYFDKNFYNQDSSYLILSTPKELNLIKKILDIDDITFKDCMNFDENIKLDLFDNYDFLSINTFELENNKALIQEINIYLSDNFILVVVKDDNFIFKYVKNMILGNFNMEDNPTVSLFKINYLIFKSIIINGFESLEKVEDMILDIEDQMMEKVSEDQISKINYVRGITRTIVKNTRPLLYIGDRILKENIRYLKYSDVKRYNLDNLQGIDFGIDKLYNFALATRELADKLLDLYSSKVGEETNDLITKLTILTGISAPLTIITGIYGMNFKYMPFLNFTYGYPIILLLMVIIVLLGLLIFKIKKLL